MTEQELKALETACPLVSTLAAAEEAVWVNPRSGCPLPRQTAVCP